MRLIDADALVYRLTEEIRHTTGEYKYGLQAARLLTVEAPTAAKDINVPDNGWISVKDRIPEDDRQVLAVKQLKSGLREVCLARCIPDWEYTDMVTKTKTCAPYWVTGGNNNIVAWMPLPDLPKEDA